MRNGSAGCCPPRSPAAFHLGKTTTAANTAAAVSSASSRSGQRCLGKPVMAMFESGKNCRSDTFVSGPN